MIDGKQMLLAMGFEHEQYTDNYEHEPNKIVTVHIITHPLIPGLFLSGFSLEEIAKNVIPCINLLARCNAETTMKNLILNGKTK